jgi:hypothetical protein
MPRINLALVYVINFFQAAGRRIRSRQWHTQNSLEADSQQQ